MRDPDLLCPGPEIIMWEPRLCRDNYVWAPWGLQLIMSGPQILCDIASIHYIFLIIFIFARCHCSWAATLPFSNVNVCNSSNVSWQCWKNGEITEGNWLNNPNPGLDQRERIFHLCLFIRISIEYMDITIHDDTWNVLNRQVSTTKIEKTRLSGYAWCWHLQRL